MNNINFLPESYTRGRARRSRVVRQVMLVAMVAGGLAAWGVLLEGQLGAKRDASRMLDDQVVAARNMMTEMNRLREDRKDLTHQIRIQRELSQPISHTGVIASIASLIPPQIALTELTMTTKRTRPESIVPEGATRSRKRAQTDAAVMRDDKIEIALQALSPDAASVANLVEAFSRHPMVTDVQMRHTRAVEVRGVAGREFRLEMQIDLNRQFMDPDQSREEVAGAF